MSTHNRRLTPAEYAAKYGLHVNTVYRYCREGREDELPDVEHVEVDPKIHKPRYILVLCDLAQTVVAVGLPIAIFAILGGAL